MAAVLVVVTVAGAGLAVALGLLGGSEDAAPPPPAPSATPSPTGTPLAEVDTTAVAVEGASFCDALTPDAVARALGAEASDAADDAVERPRRWDNGERARLGDGVRDVAHEHGCAWTGPRRAVADAWVFAPPVTPREARRVIDGWTSRRGCSVVDGAPALGSPSATLACRGDVRRTRVVVGLVGDAWLTCRVGALAGSVTAEDLAGRGSAWCSAVLGAARADG